MKRLLFFIMLGVVASLIVWQQAEVPPAQAPVGPAFRPPRAPGPREHRKHRFAARPAPPVQDGRVQVGDIPVAIVPGTRVTEAEIEPPAPPVPPAAPTPVPAHVTAYRPESSKEHVSAFGTRSVLGRLSATEDRACDDARKQLEHVVSEWLVPEVPSSWQPPKSMLNAATLAIDVKPVEKELGTLYEATIQADLSPERRVQFIETYHRQLVSHRLTVLGGVLAFVLACLAALAGYIKADEATKGYYTNRLRVVSAAGVGAAGVLIYQLLS